jgi:cytochrome b involved in lipid metabolism
MCMGSGRTRNSCNGEEDLGMETLKQDAIQAISKLPESATIDDIMYELYVIDKVNKGREAAKRGESVSVEDLKREMQSW